MVLHLGARGLRWVVLQLCNSGTTRSELRLKTPHSGTKVDLCKPECVPPSNKTASLGRSHSQVLLQPDDLPLLEVALLSETVKSNLCVVQLPLHVPVLTVQEVRC